MEQHTNHALEVDNTDIDVVVPDSLEGLDWDAITCQSTSGCRNRATHIVHLHAVDGCNDPDLDSSGNVIDILCARCLAEVAHEAHRQAVQFHRYLDPFCLTCGAPVKELADIVRAVTML